MKSTEEVFKNRHPKPESYIKTPEVNTKNIILKEGILSKWSNKLDKIPATQNTVVKKTNIAEIKSARNMEFQAVNSSSKQAKLGIVEELNPN